MERIFYFSGHRMTVFDWDGKELFGSRDFQPNEAGFEDFEKLLRSSVNFPSRLLVDMIEEDFRRESIPHVNFLDRRDLINRQLERHYREEDYSYARVIGRSKVGRRDDQILLSALTNTGLLAPWLERLEKFDIQLMGIWSLPMLAEKFAKPMQIRHEHVLIVSRQVRSALRNCYLHNGKLMISRQAKFDREMWDREDFEGVISNLERSTSELHTFLINQRTLTVDETLHVYCLIPRSQITIAEGLCESNRTVRYSFVALEDMFQHFGLRGCEGLGSDALYSYLCTQKNPLYDHYAKEDQKTTYYRHLMDRLVRNVAEVGSLILVTIAVLLALKGMELDSQRQLVERDIELLRHNNEVRFGDIQEELQNAPLIRDAVELVGLIQADGHQSPHEYFGVISRVLGKTEYRPIRLLQLEWRKHAALEAMQIARDQRSQLKTYDPSGYSDPYAQVGLEVEAEGEYIQRRAILKLKGKINTQDLTYRETIDTMQRFVDELALQEEIEDVILVKTAADVREASRFTDQITGQARSQVASNEFEIVLIVGGAESV
ncbi:MAG: hypothetical protein JJ956_09425 [Pseudomonadales bacterium]|nr:hypothetical protein [Pseudomonadales bacterium]